MNEKLKVTFEVCARLPVAGECEMTREEYDQWCERLNNARGGWENENAADELMMLAEVDISDGDIDDLEVEDFVAPATLKARAV